jgi:putative transposase
MDLSRTLEPPHLRPADRQGPSHDLPGRASAIVARRGSQRIFLQIVHRWVARYSPELLKRFNARKRIVTSKWHIDETTSKTEVAGCTFTELSTAMATRLSSTSASGVTPLRPGGSCKALKRHGRPERIVTDGSQTNREAILRCDAESRPQDRSRRRLTPIRIRQSRYLNKRIEQDHRAIKRRVRPMLGLQFVATACVILGGIEMVHMMRKQQAKYARNPTCHWRSNLSCWRPEPQSPG